MLTGKRQISLIILILPLSIVNALSDNQKWAILDSFKKKQYDLLFESNLWDFSNEFSDIFSISKKVDIYDNISNDAKTEREKVESKKNEVIEKITSLELSIKQLDSDISTLLSRVKDINK